MKPFKTITATQVVAYNKEDPNTQVITKEDVNTTTTYLWGLIKIVDIKDITQSYGGNKTKLGF